MWDLFLFMDESRFYLEEGGEDFFRGIDSGCYNHGNFYLPSETIKTAINYFKTNASQKEINLLKFSVLKLGNTISRAYVLNGGFVALFDKTYEGIYMEGNGPTLDQIESDAGLRRNLNQLELEIDKGPLDLPEGVDLVEGTVF
jgi:hypothetical protein